MSEKMIPLKLADLSVAACEAEIQKLRDENARLKTELDGYSNVVSTAHADLASENARLKAEVERLKCFIIDQMSEISAPCDEAEQEIGRQVEQRQHWEQIAKEGKPSV